MWMFPKIVGFPPKSSILIGFSINHPFWGIPILGNTHMRRMEKFGGLLKVSRRGPERAFFYPYAPNGTIVYLPIYEWLISIGKYSSPMEHLGEKAAMCFFSVLLP